MAINQQHKARRSRRNRRGSADINITPLVDVMLVLLIVFMVSAPLMITGQNVDLPNAKSSIVPTQKQPIVVSVDKTGKIFLAEKPTDINNLVSTLSAIYDRTPDNRIFLRGDTNANYGVVIQVMARISKIGFKKISLITEDG